MHRALHVAEITRLVCDNANRSTLVALARCCNAWYQEAMPVLWSKLDNLAPLVGTLPSDSWMVEERVLSLTRPLLPSDWATFLKLATHVRTITPSYRQLNSREESLANATLQTDVISSLSAQRPRKIVFPNLRFVDQEALTRSHERIADFLVMVGPQLTHLCMDRFNSPGQLLRALTVVYTQFLQLQDFFVGQAYSGDLEGMPSPLSVSPPWIAASPLVKFDCDQLTLTEETIGALSTLANLEALSVRLPHRDSFPHINSANSPFSNLRELDIVASSNAYVAFTNAVGTSGFPRVRQFTLQVDYKTPNTVLPRDLVNVITASLASEVVVVLSMSAHDVDDALDVAAMPIDSLAFFYSDDFRPFLKFLCMHEFTLSLPWVYDVDDALLLDVAKAWPELWAFYLGSDSYCMWVPPPRGPTLRALPPFAVHCPSLTELGFQFNAMEITRGSIPPSSELYGELRNSSSCSRSNLYGLHVATSPIANTERVAGFISCVFPELTQLSAGSFDVLGDVGSELAERWDEVSRFLPILKMVRENERKRVEFDQVEGWPGDDSAVSPITTP